MNLIIILIYLFVCMYIYDCSLYIQHFYTEIKHENLCNVYIANKMFFSIYNTNKTHLGKNKDQIFKQL